MSDSNPQALFSYVTAQLNRFGLAYLHVIQPRVKGNVVIGEGQAPVASEQLRKISKGKIIAAGGFEPDSAEAIVEKGDADLETFGRAISSRIPICPSASDGDCRSMITTATRSTPSMRTVIQTTRSTICAPPHSFFNVTGWAFRPETIVLRTSR